MKIRTREQTAVLRHPKDPELEVEVRRLTAADQLRFREELGKLAVKKATIGPDNQVIRTQDATGNWRVDSERFVPFNLEFMMKSMRAVVKDVRGLIDEDDNPIPFVKGEPDRVLMLLFEEELSVDVPVRDEKGLPAGETMPQSFGLWILDRASEKETFSPLTKSSPASSSASTTGELSSAASA